VKKQQGAKEVYEYRFDKHVFVVTPVYSGSSGKTIHELLLGLMRADSGNSENHCNSK